MQILSYQLFFEVLTAS